MTLGFRWVLKKLNRKRTKGIWRFTNAIWWTNEWVKGKDDAVEGEAEPTWRNFFNSPSLISDGSELWLFPKKAKITQKLILVAYQKLSDKENVQLILKIIWSKSNININHQCLLFLKLLIPNYFNHMHHRYIIGIITKT